jgi:hypothetical protein
MAIYESLSVAARTGGGVVTTTTLRCTNNSRSLRSRGSMPILPTSVVSVTPATMVLVLLTALTTTAMMMTWKFLHSPQYIQLDNTTITTRKSSNTPTTTTFVSHLPHYILQRWFSSYSTKSYTKLFLVWKEWLLLSSVRPYVWNHSVTTITTTPLKIIDHSVMYVYNKTAKILSFVVTFLRQQQRRQRTDGTLDRPHHDDVDDDTRHSAASHPKNHQHQQQRTSTNGHENQRMERHPTTTLRNDAIKTNHDDDNTEYYHDDYDVRTVGTKSSCISSTSTITTVSGTLTSSTRMSNCQWNESSLFPLPVQNVHDDDPPRIMQQNQQKMNISSTTMVEPPEDDENDPYSCMDDHIDFRSNRIVSTRTMEQTVYKLRKVVSASSSSSSSSQHNNVII